MAHDTESGIDYSSAFLASEKNARALFMPAKSIKMIDVKNHARTLDNAVGVAVVVLVLRAAGRVVDVLKHQTLGA